MPRLSSWTPDEVAAWLEDLGLRSKYGEMGLEGDDLDDAARGVGGLAGEAQLRFMGVDPNDATRMAEDLRRQLSGADPRSDPPGDAAHKTFATATPRDKPPAPTAGSPEASAASACASRTAAAAASAAARSATTARGAWWFTWSPAQVAAWARPQFPVQAECLLQHSISGRDILDVLAPDPFQFRASDKLCWATESAPAMQGEGAAAVAAALEREFPPDHLEGNTLLAELMR
jgi:hypothetical protein